MTQQLFEDFFDELEGYISKDDADEMRGILSLFNDEDISATLSLPHELRERKFTEFENALKNHTSTPKDLIEKMVKVSSKYNFGIGYHTSPNEIRPDENGHWSIKGTESDHRDGDRAMAYYSKKYRHLFKKKNPQFVYIVRTEPDTHKSDGNWSRATELSIVTSVPFKDVFEYVEKTAHSIYEKKKDSS